MKYKLYIHVTTVDRLGVWYVKVAESNSEEALSIIAERVYPWYSCTITDKDLD